MICVTIGRGRHSSLLEEWKAAAEAGAELVELRHRLPAARARPQANPGRTAHADGLHHPPGGATAGSGGATRRSGSGCSARRSSLGVDYVDLEMDIAAQIRRFGKTKRIISYHNLKKTPDDLADIAEQCDELDADVVKIATLASSLADAVAGPPGRRAGGGPDDRHRDGRGRLLHADPGRQVRGPVHLRRLQPRPRSSPPACPRSRR